MSDWTVLMRRLELTPGSRHWTEGRRPFEVLDVWTSIGGRTLKRIRWLDTDEEAQVDGGVALGSTPMTPIEALTFAGR